MAAAGDTQFHWPAQTTTKINAMFAADAAAMTPTGTVVIAPEASASVRFAMNSAQIAPTAEPSHGPRLRITTTHSRACATTSSAATTIVGAHSIADTPAQPSTTMDAAITPAACSSPAYTASELAVSASVSTASAPKSGHGGVDHRG